MEKDKIEKLFKLVKIGKMEVKNRIVMPPMCTRLAFPDGSVSQRLIDYYEERARGGVGLIIVEYSYIDDKDSKSHPNQLGIYHDKLIAGLNELAEAVQLHGAKVILQINHAGRQTSISVMGNQPVAPSSMPCYKKEEIARELTLEEIEEIVKSYAEAAERVKEAGFNGVEIHGAHGYLIDQFLSPYTNHRPDKYGQDRMMFALEIISQVRKKVGKDFPVGFRISGDEYIDGGLTLTQTKKIAQRIEVAGIDYIHVSGGIGETVDWLIQPMYYPQGCLAHLAGGIKQDVNIPVIAVGSITDPLMAEKVLRENKADLIAMGRALIADPQLPRKAAKGKIGEICRCIRCNEGCLKRSKENKTLRCTVNPAAGREDKMRILPAGKSKKILVIGSGPAGLEVSRIAALRGHQVVLWEKEEEIGGNLRIASRMRFKAELKNLIEYFSFQIKKLGIKVELCKEATAEMVEEIKPDVVIIAIGARLLIPKIPGISKPSVMTVIEVLTGRRKVGKNIIVAGGGSVGCEIALFLAQQDKKVTIIEMSEEAMVDLDLSSKIALKRLLSDNNVEILTSVKVEQITDDGVVVINKEWNLYSIKADTIVLALGFEPNRKLIKSLQYKIPQLYSIGDCVKPGKIMQAMEQASFLARQI